MQRNAAYISLAWLSLSACRGEPARSDAGVVDAESPRQPQPSGEQACALEQLTTTAADAQPWQDCGVLPASASADVLAAARQCVENARDAQRPFRLIWDESGIDSRVRRAVLGIRAAQGYTLSYFSFDSAGTGSDGARAIILPCATLSFASDCIAAIQLCVSCSAPASNLQCRCVVSTDGGASSVVCE